MLDEVLFLAADTARSNAYAQALEARGIRVGHTLLLRRPGSAAPGGAGLHHPVGEVAGVILPDLRRSLDEVCATVGGEIETLLCSGVKEPAVLERVCELAPKLVIYSGFGGELVPADLLRLGAPFLHMHAGWLPGYRGSTTVYYSLLAEGRCAVSAILLEPSIDCGPIVARRHYPAPPPGVDVDYLYDNAIRADLMVRALESWAADGAFGEALEQSGGEGGVYYVIHPVLKHLAMLGLEQGSIREAGE